jgi:hypothetical protein
MILFRLRYRPVTATAYRDSPSATVTYRYASVTGRERKRNKIIIFTLVKCFNNILVFFVCKTTKLPE